MTRKRFIKFCMSDGASRNEARAAANYVVAQNKLFAAYNKISKKYEEEFRFSMISYNSLLHTKSGRYTTDDTEHIQSHH